MRRLLTIVLALGLGACVNEPRGLVTREDYEDWRDLKHDRDRDPSDGAPGPPRPGYADDFGESDWRYGEFNPPSINPDALVDDLDVWSQVGNSPSGGRVWNMKGKEDVDLLIYGSSEDVDPNDDAGDDAYDASGAAVIRIPF